VAHPDPDRLLADYRAALAQAALFEAGGSRSRLDPAGHDEFVDRNGEVRPGWSELAEVVGERGALGLDRLADTVTALVDRDGISYIAVDENGDEGDAAPRPWHLDSLPLLIAPEDWAKLESGVAQRSRMLDAVLADLYGPLRAVTEGVLPPQLLFAHPGYLRAARGIQIPGGHQLFLHACDVSRDPSGTFVVNADWTQSPSGAGFALADRRVVAHAAPDLFERFGPRPNAPFAQTLRLALLEAAPEAAEDPVVVLLSPGIYSETAFDQAYLASVLGFPLVESADLVVRDGKLWMRSLGTLERVDVVLRRVDAEYTDPLDLRSDSRLGVVGLVEAQRRGTVTVVNTLGSGILESPGLLRFLPELAQQLLGETPLLSSAPMYWGGLDAERSHLLTHVSSLLIKPTVGGRTIVGPSLSADQREKLAARISAAPWQWVGQELPQFSSAPAALLPGKLTPVSVGMRLFSVSQHGGYAPMVGGLGYVLADGPGAYDLRTVAAKDVWVRPPTRAQAEPTFKPTRPVPLSVVKRSGTRGVSSPRVLSDLFWLGRYAERAESMARLLTVTRERCHEFRHRPAAEGSECVPVLVSALGALTGTDAGGPDLVAAAPRTLRALTIDRGRPGSLAQSVERLGQAARSVRDQMSNDTWMVLGGVERILAQLARQRPDAAVSPVDDTALASAHARTLSGMLALSGVMAESVVRDVDWTMIDIGKRIERALWLTTLLRSTLATVHSQSADRTIIESVLVACESSVIYLRRNVGTFSVAAVADLVLFETENPRSLVYQLERLRANLRALPGASGSSRPARLVEEISTRLRRLDPGDLDQVTATGERTELAELLDGIHHGLRELSAVITTTQLSLPGAMQPLGGPGRRRRVP
jgi:uncharacterized circularly permuted ATP-grasp superfamily protein/uncharacterized alpha-E superfamily protein